MECLQDLRNLMAGVVHGQSSGSYTLEEAEQVAPIVRRLLQRFPELQSNAPVQTPVHTPAPAPVPVPVPAPVPVAPASWPCESSPLKTLSDIRPTTM